MMCDCESDPDRYWIGSGRSDGCPGIAVRRTGRRKSPTRSTLPVPRLITQSLPHLFSPNISSPSHSTRTVTERHHIHTDSTSLHTPCQPRAHSSFHMLHWLGSSFNDSATLRRASSAAFKGSTAGSFTSSHGLQSCRAI